MTHSLDPTLAQVRSNPLLSPSPLDLQFPPFDQILDSDFAPALEQGMARQLLEVEAIAGNPAAADFDNTLVALERSGRLLDRVRTLLYGLISADSTPARLQVQADYAARLAAHTDAIRLNDQLFERIDALFERRERLGLDGEGRRLLERYHRDFLRAGARLDPAQKTRMKAINAELAALSSKFTQDVLAEVNDAAVIVQTREELAGFSEAQIAGAAAAAQARKLDGRYLIALLNTTTQPVLAELQDRALRERVYRASIARGSRGNAFDTRAAVARTLALRAERAALLGFATFADFELADNMAKTPAAVNGLLRRLVPAALAAARREAAEMQGLLDAEQAAQGRPGWLLAGWDWAFYSERLRAAKYGFDAAQLKPYLELRNVQQRGVFHAANKLFGLTFKQRLDLPVYHPDVEVFDVIDADGRPLALFISDLYARPSKRGGAWMNAYVEQNGLLGELPVVGNHQNIAKPPPGEPTLLGWEEVVTMFHEFGHALHGMLSTVRYPSLSGTNVPRDFVEFPSQVYEMWADWPEVLAHYALHWQTGEPMPQALLEKMNAARRFKQGFLTTEYLGASVLDQRLHQLSPDQVPTADELMDFEARVLAQEGFTLEAVLPRYRTPYFSHVMGGYSAGYYSYIWAEVLDADAARWIEAQGGLTRANGDALREKVLSRGGSEDSMQLFRNLVGREPDIAPLLERRGLN